MRDIAFPARISAMRRIGAGSSASAIEILTSGEMTDPEAKFLGKLDFYGDAKNHYLLETTRGAVKDKLVEAGIDDSLAQSIILSGRESNLEKGFRKPMIMAIVNATPDSFYAGSRMKQDAGLLDMIISAGPDIIDVGGESTRPGSSEVSISEEIGRLEPVIDYLNRNTDIPISLDTRHPDVLEKFSGKVSYANDITGFSSERMARIAAENGLSCISMHMRGHPSNMQENTGYVDMIPEIIAFLLESTDRLVHAGVDRKKIIIDPGIGFSKDLKGNLEILKEIDSFKMGYQVLVGASRKSFIGQVTGRDVSGRLPGTLALTAYLAMKGVDIIRVHDPGENRDVLKILESIC